MNASLMPIEECPYVFRGHLTSFERHHDEMLAQVRAKHRTVDYRRLGSLNFPIEGVHFSELYSAFLSECARVHRDIFGTPLELAPENRRVCWALVRDETRTDISNWHHHVRTSVYNGVYYLDASTGDSIVVKVPSDPRTFDRFEVWDRIKPLLNEGADETNDYGLSEFTIPVVAGTLLIMPNWVYHNPGEACRHTRVSLNIEAIVTRASFATETRAPSVQYASHHLARRLWSRRGPSHRP